MRRGSSILLVILIPALLLAVPGLLRPPHATLATAAPVASPVPGDSHGLLLLALPNEAGNDFLPAVAIATLDGAELRRITLPGTDSAPRRALSALFGSRALVQTDDGAIYLIDAQRGEATR